MFLICLVDKVVCLFTCAGLGGAVGYALGGLDWTHTFLGAAFKSQEQILFFFAAILFSVSVVLHLFSIEEERYSPQHERLDQVGLVLCDTQFKIKKMKNPKTSVSRDVTVCTPLVAL